MGQSIGGKFLKFGKSNNLDQSQSKSQYNCFPFSGFYLNDLLSGKSDVDNHAS